MRLPKCLPVSRKGPRSAEMNEHILLVEDEQALRTALEIRLRAEGYVLDTAVDGEEALRKATNMPFDLIVLDVMLPVRNGFEVCREVRQQGMATPILMLTVRDKLVDKVVGLNLRSEEHTSELQSHSDLVCRLLLEKKKLSMLRTFSSLQFEANA